MNKEMYEEIVSRIAGRPIAVELKRTWPFGSRGLTYPDEGRVVLWLGWPKIDSRLLAIHEGAHFWSLEHNEVFRDFVGMWAREYKIPCWWVWIHSLNGIIFSLLPKSWRLLLFRE